MSSSNHISHQNHIRHHSQLSQLNYPEKHHQLAASVSVVNNHNHNYQHNNPTLSSNKSMNMQILNSNTNGNGGNISNSQSLSPSLSPTSAIQETERRMNLLLSSFASLLSFAHSNGVQLPTDDNARKLSTLLSRFSLHNININTKTTNANTSTSTSTSTGNNYTFSSGTCSLPSLRLRNHTSFSSKPFKDASLQDLMAVNLASQVLADRSTIDQVPKMLLQNTASSFEELISSRLRVSMQAITRTILKLGSEGNDARVLRKLLTTTSKPVKVITVVTSYQIINVDNSPGLTPDGAIIRPLVFETIVDLSIFGKTYTISLEAPGTIAANLSTVDNLLDNVQIMFDTMSLLKMMMTQARAIVKKTLKRATSITTTVTNYQQMKQESRNDYDVHVSSSSLSSSSCNNTNNNNNNNSSSSCCSSSSITAQKELLASYPQHLRETVSHFLPEVETTQDINIEGFPPNLLRTLKSLAGGDNDDGNEDISNDNDQHLPSNNNQLHQGLFSWMSNDDIMLSQAKNSSSSNHNNNNNGIAMNNIKQSLSSLKRRMNSYNENFDHPLLKKSKTVSFCLPGGN